MTCNAPLNYSSNHPPKCGLPAVARLTIGISNQLAELVVCERHKKKIPGSDHLDWRPL